MEEKKNFFSQFLLRKKRIRSGFKKVQVSKLTVFKESGLPSIHLENDKGKKKVIISDSLKQGPVISSVSREMQLKLDPL